jgi:hypothetical protein
MFKINRKLKFQTEQKRVRKIKINKENLVDGHDTGRDNGKSIKTDKPWKVYDFEDISDNFYLNVLDIYDSTNIALGTKTGVSVFDPTGSDLKEKYKYDSSSEIFCVKLM